MCSQLEVTEMLQPSFQRNTLLHRSCGLYAWKWGLESVLVMVGQLNPRVWVLGFLITMPRKKQDGGDDGPGPEPIPFNSKL